MELTLTGLHLLCYTEGLWAGCGGMLFASLEAPCALDRSLHFGPERRSGRGGAERH